MTSSESAYKREYIKGTPVKNNRRSLKTKFNTTSGSGYVPPVNTFNVKQESTSSNSVRRRLEARGSKIK